MPAVISDASPLIYLTHLGRFALLREIYESVLIPPAVWKEVGERGAQRLEGRTLAAAISEGWVKIEAPQFAPPHTALAKLGAGEREAIQLAFEKHATLLIDEANGRAIALQLGISLSGTLGVLAEAKRRKLIPLVRPELNRLLNETNFRVSEVIRQHVLQLADEA
jgi:uncharacterized protein